jgi:beta-lactamase class D
MRLRSLLATLLIVLPAPAWSQPKPSASGSVSAKPAATRPAAKAVPVRPTGKAVPQRRAVSPVPTRPATAKPAAAKPSLKPSPARPPATRPAAAKPTVKPTPARPSVAKPGPTHHTAKLIRPRSTAKPLINRSAVPTAIPTRAVARPVATHPPTGKPVGARPTAKPVPMRPAAPKTSPTRAAVKPVATKPPVNKAAPIRPAAIKPGNVRPTALPVGGNRFEQRLTTLLGARKGSITVMRVSDGRILAMVHPELAAGRAIPPGSVMKVPTVVAGWQEAVLNDHRLIPCDGPTGDPACWQKHGPIDLLGALSKSCSAYVGTVGRELGAKRLIGWWRRLGFGVPTGIDVAKEASGRLPAVGDRVNWAETGVGDSPAITVTPVQIAACYAAIANGGQRWRPAIRQPKALSGMLFAAGGLDLGLIRRALADAVTHGSAVGAAPPGLSVAGKTGTASMPEIRNRTSGWFAGFAPVDRPEVVVVVALDDAKGYIHAVPLAKQVFAAWQADFRHSAKP